MRAKALAATLAIITLAACGCSENDFIQSNSAEPSTSPTLAVDSGRSAALGNDQQFTRSDGWVHFDANQMDVKQSPKSLEGHPGVQFSKWSFKREITVNFKCAEIDFRKQCLEFPFGRDWVVKEVIVYQGSGGKFCYRVIAAGRDAGHHLFTVYDLDGDGLFDTLDNRAADSERLDVPEWVGIPE